MFQEVNVSFKQVDPQPTKTETTHGLKYIVLQTCELKQLHNLSSQSIKFIKTNCKLMKLVGIKKISRNNHGFTMILPKCDLPSTIITNEGKIWMLSPLHAVFHKTQPTLDFKLVGVGCLDLPAYATHYRPSMEDYLFYASKKKYPLTLISYAAEPQFSSAANTDARNALPFS